MGASDGARHAQIQVMVVDDSAVVRGLLTRTLESDPLIKVAASVGNGSMALAALDRAEIEVVILDVEMPVMDGLTALPKLIRARPGIQVIMASTMTRKNAAVSLKALAAGAADYIAKPSSNRELNSAEDFKRELVGKVKALAIAARASRGLPMPRAREPVAAESPPARPHGGRPVRLRDAPILAPAIIGIGSSTGGPQALLTLLSSFAAAVNLPILVTQHMPAMFTTILAEHLAHACGIPAAEAQDGEPVAARRIYVAPGDFHMTVELENARKVVRLSKGPPENYCRPSVDPMLRSLARVYGGHVLAVILTGMGQDGLRGAEAVAAAGGAVVAQDQATSVVWGMPGAAATAGLCNAVLPLPEIAAYIRKLVLRSAA